MSRLKRAFFFFALLILVPIAVYAINVTAGYYAARADSGTVHVAGLHAPVQIVRDGRGIAHVVAASDSDMFFGEGYAEGADRLFQIDLIRRFVSGRLSELVGASALETDEQARIVPVERIAQIEFDHMPAGAREALQAFSDGVNAAIQHEPLPIEYRLLLTRPKPWTPQDSLVAGFSTVLDLNDKWDHVILRDNVALAVGDRIQRELYSITDPAYDAPVTDGPPARVARLSDRSNMPLPQPNAFPADVPQDTRFASNDFAIGALRSANGHAVLANDPHLRLGVPGVWYLIDLRSPSTHVAGATLAGVPGVILGHNEHIAWGVTNGTTITESLYRALATPQLEREEIFHVRFGKEVKRMYHASARGFLAGGHEDVVVDWPIAKSPVSAGTAFLTLDRATSIAQAFAALRAYNGPPQNFVFADTRGNVAYHLAGPIPDDPLWGLRIHPQSDPQYQIIPFDRLPHVDPSRSATVFTANNRMYGRAYQYRLSAGFSAPYRAKRIEQLLSAKQKLDIADLLAIQSDTLSLPELELARATVAASVRKHVRERGDLKPVLDALANWDGHFDGPSQAATIAYDLRRAASQRLAKYNTGSAYDDYEASASNADVMVLLRVLREKPRGWWANSDYDELLVSTLQQIVRKDTARAHEPWSQAGAVGVKHPLAAMGFSFLNGGIMPGNGDAFAPHVLMSEPRSQSFRAVWDPQDWDGGGIIIPSGESGEPGSHHYADLRNDWLRSNLQPLPFSAQAVAKAARATLTLTP